MSASKSVYDNRLTRMFYRQVSAVVSAISALVCFLLLVLFARSFWIADELHWHFSEVDNVAECQRSLFLRTGYGSTLIAYRLFAWPSTSGAVKRSWSYDRLIDFPGAKHPGGFQGSLGGFTGKPSTVWNHAGIRWESKPGGKGAGGYSIQQINLNFPILLPIALTAVLPAAAWLMRRRRHKSVEQSRCRFCGYNLTGNTSGVCPECGKPVAFTTDQLQIS